MPTYGISEMMGLQMKDSEGNVIKTKKDAENMVTKIKELFNS